MNRLSDRSFAVLWGALGLLAAVASVTLGFIGQVNDWIRMVGYVAALGVAWLLSKGRWARPAMFGVFVASYLLILWMALDAQSLLNRFNLGVLGYGILIAQTTLGLCLHFGWSGAVFGSVAGVVLLLPYSRDGAWVFATYLNVATAALGAVIQRLLTQLRTAKADLERMALVDELTGLENRRALGLTLPRYEALASRRSAGLLVTSWDLNDLKRINDSEGHAAGDAHLQRFAEVLRHEARLEDAFFRMGGDEFVGLHLGLTTGTDLLERVQAQFPPVAAGWAVVDARGFEPTLAEADRLLYANKAQMKQASLAPANGSLEVLGTPN